MWAKLKVSMEGFSATPARPGPLLLLLFEIRPEPVDGLLTAVAHDEWFALFDPEYWNKKQAQILVHTLIGRLIQPAHRTPARILIQDLFFR